jgi:light-regulated signal transduction histidine kinase (bacteriophytochrome)
MKMFIFLTGMRSTAARQNPRPEGRGSFTYNMELQKTTKVGWRWGKKSAGLGSSIVKTIMEAHRGFIECKSELKKGTAFILHLPRN